MSWHTSLSQHGRKNRSYYKTKQRRSTTSFFICNGNTCIKVLIPEVRDPTTSPPSFIAMVLNHLLRYSYLPHHDCAVNSTHYHVKLILV